MKTNIFYICIAAIIALLLNACSVSKINVNQAEYTSSNVKALPIIQEKDNNCFVQYKNGQVQIYKTLQLKTGVFATPYLLADGKTKILPSQVHSYKDANYFAISQQVFYSKNKTHVAINVLPGFAIREQKGSINLYALQFYGSGSIYKKYFLQKGEDGKILPITNALLKEIAAESIQTATLVKQLNKKKVDTKILLEVVENYNNARSLSIN